MSYEEMKERGRRTRLMTREHRCIAFFRVRESWGWRPSCGDCRVLSLERLPVELGGGGVSAAVMDIGSDVLRWDRLTPVGAFPVGVIAE